MVKISEEVLGDWCSDTLAQGWLEGWKQRKITHKELDDKDYEEIKRQRQTLVRSLQGYLERYGDNLEKGKEG